MSIVEIQRELENKIREQKYREENTKEQQQAVENIMRNETGECIDGFENPHERSQRYLKMDEVNEKISRERSQANGENRDEGFYFGLNQIPMPSFFLPGNMDKEGRGL